MKFLETKVQYFNPIKIVQITKAHQSNMSKLQKQDSLKLYLELVH